MIAALVDACRASEQVKCPVSFVMSKGVSMALSICGDGLILMVLCN